MFCQFHGTSLTKFDNLCYMLNSFMSLDIIDIPLYLFSNDLDLSVCSEVIHLSEIFRTFSYVIENIWVCLKVILSFQCNILVKMKTVHLYKMMSRGDTKRSHQQVKSFCKLFLQHVILSSMFPIGPFDKYLTLIGWWSSFSVC